MFGRIGHAAGLSGCCLELEGNLREALSGTQWGAPGSLLRKIAQKTRSYKQRQLILHHIWQALDEKNKKSPRRILQALSLLETVLTCGHQNVVSDIRGAFGFARVQFWQNKHLVEDGREVGTPIRRKAGDIAELLVNDCGQLEKARAKNEGKADHMVGFGSPVQPPAGSTNGSMLTHITRKAFGSSHQATASKTLAPRLPPRPKRRALVDQFCGETSATRERARDYLKRCAFEYDSALAMYKQEIASRKPVGFLEQQSRREQVKQAARVSERRANELLERCGGDVEAAIKAHSATEKPERAKPPVLLGGERAGSASGSGQKQCTSSAVDIRGRTSPRLRVANSCRSEASSDSSSGSSTSSSSSEDEPARHSPRNPATPRTRWPAQTWSQGQGTDWPTKSHQPAAQRSTSWGPSQAVAGSKQFDASPTPSTSWNSFGDSPWGGSSNGSGTHTSAFGGSPWAGSNKPSPFGFGFSKGGSGSNHGVSDWPSARVDHHVGTWVGLKNGCPPTGSNCRVIDSNRSPRGITNGNFGNSSCHRDGSFF